MKEIGKKPALSYNTYLKVPELLELQNTLSDPESHDELLFIIIHQTYELWFKQILHEIDGAIVWLREGRFFRANHALKVVTAIEDTLVGQIQTLEKMAPIGFLEFRDKLNPASGFQSMQFRELEFVSGSKDEELLKHFVEDDLATENLKRRAKEPTIADEFWNSVARAGLDIENREQRVNSILEILQEPEKYPDLYVLQDLLIDHDRNIALWRYHHVLMVERMLGSKKGTGGSAGAAYLMSTINKRFYPEIWEARTLLSYDPV